MFRVLQASAQSIVTDSLQLHVDAGITDSYPGSGNTWSDLSGNGYNLTLANTTYSAADGGKLVFNGTSSSAQFDAYIATIEAYAASTVELWFNFPGGSVYRLPWSFADYSSYDAGSHTLWVGDFTGAWADETLAFAMYAGGGIQTSCAYRAGHTALFDSVWHQAVIAGTTTSNAMYLDGELMSLTYNAGSASSDGNMSAGTGYDSARIMGRRWSIATTYSAGDAAVFRIYNAELDAAAIKHNFMVQRGRFGV